VEVKRPSRAAANSPVYNVEVKNGWICIFTAHLRSWHVKERFYFYIYLSILLLGPNTVKIILGRLLLSPVEARLLYHLKRFNRFANMAIFSIMVTINLNIWLGIRYVRAWGSVVVKALRYKSEGPGIDSRCRRGFFPWNLIFPCALGLTQPLKVSTRIILGVKAAGA